MTKVMLCAPLWRHAAEMDSAGKMVVATVFQDSLCRRAASAKESKEPGVGSLLGGVQTAFW